MNYLRPAITLFIGLAAGTAALAGDLRINVQEFDAPGVWKKPCGAFRVEAWITATGGNGGVGGTNTTTATTAGKGYFIEASQNLVYAGGGGPGKVGAGSTGGSVMPGPPGGGGGGASRNGSPSGAGGNGAPGRVVIITYARNE